jgi:hypothetical protein
MFRRFIMFAISVLFLSAGVVAQNLSPQMPEHLRYYFVFRQLSLLNQKAVAAERKGEDSSKYRLHYKNFAKLSDRQMSQLDQIANDCLREVASYDDRIKQLVNEARAGLQGRKLEPGMPAPEPSAELKQIDAERDRVIRRAYTQLIDSFGEREFRRFNERIGKSVRVNPIQVGARKGESREIPAVASEAGMVNGITMIQEVDGNVLFYTVTILDALTYFYYNSATVGSLYNGDTNSLIYSADALGGEIAEVMATIPALPNTTYVGLGQHYVVSISYVEPYGWFNPFCFGYDDFPLPDVGERTFTGSEGQCYSPTPYIHLGYTLKSIVTQGE